MSDRGVKQDRLHAVLPAVAILVVAFGGLTLGTYPQYALCLAIIAAVIGVALNMIVGYARIITLATGAMTGLGAYGAALLMARAGLPFPLALLGGALAGGIGGALLAAPATRFRGHYLAMVTLVFQMVAIIAIRQATSLTGGAAGLRVPPVDLFGLPLQGDGAYLVFAGFACALAVLIFTILLRGHFGKALRATSMSEIGASAFGISTRDYHFAAFTISSAGIAYAGAILAPRVRILDPESFGFLSSAEALAYPIVGGLTSVWGGLLGGGLLRLLPELLRGLHEFQEIFYAALVIAAIRFLPGGVIDAVQERARRRPDQKQLGSLVPSSITLSEPVLQRPQHAAAHTPALQLRGLSKSFGALAAVKNVSLNVRAGSIHGIIGPNGAGKTTLFNMISGFVAADNGEIRIFEEDVTTSGAIDRIRFGVTRTFQNIATFRRLTCLDNVVLGLGRNGVGGALAMSFADVLSNPSARARRHIARNALAEVGIAHLAEVEAGLLSLGDQRRLEIARAIVSRPRLVLFDEPVSGVAGYEEDRIADLLARINRDMSITMLIIEHNIGFIRRLSSDLTVMACGEVIADGAPEAVLADAGVRSAYFGEARLPA